MHVMETEESHFVDFGEETIIVYEILFIGANILGNDTNKIEIPIRLAYSNDLP